MDFPKKLLVNVLFVLFVKQNSDIVRGKGVFTALRVATADGGAMVAACGDSVQKRVGELAQLAGLPTHQESRGILAVNVLVVRAVFARHFLAFKNRDS